MPARRSDSPEAIKLVQLAYEEVGARNAGRSVLAIANAASWDEALLKAARRRSGRHLEDVRRVIDHSEQCLPGKVHQAIVTAHARVRDGSLERWCQDYAAALCRGETLESDELLIDVSR